MRVALLFLSFFSCLAAAPVAAAGVSTPKQWLVIGKVDERGRRPFNPDRIFARYLLDPAAPPPREGERVGEQTWTKVAVDEKGFVHGGYVYAYAALEIPEREIVLARLPGGGRLYVNGDAFVGDVYGMRHSGVPILLRAGTNHLFVRGVRGRFRMELAEVSEGLHVAARDATLPHLVRGRKAAMLGAAVVMNATASARPGFPPLGVHKLPFEIRLPVVGESAGVKVEATFGPAARTFELEVVEAGAARRITFRSEIDGSVQEYSVLPAAGEDFGVVLTLHGAGVDAFGQVRSYSKKRDFLIVAPTNRRPFGFDWQDWGRRDAYEVLAHALAASGADARRVYLTGHSMGGHGTWHLAANDPDRFAAIAPSAGWCSFDTYGGRPAGPRDALWKGADGSSLTLDLVRNLVSIPTFILHGVEDDNVPLREARRMEEAILKAGGGVSVHYQKGAGHWWDGDVAQGVDCVDWPGIFALFSRSRPRVDPDVIDFTTVDPGVDADHDWVHVEQPWAYGVRSRIEAKRTEKEVTITTENVRRFRARVGERAVVVDGTAFDARGDVWFLRRDAGWTVAAPAAGEKSPGRSGPFKRAFANRFVLVYGAQDPEGMRRARFEGQMWWYRGNGDAPVVSDEEFLKGGFAGRNVILFGNESTNGAFRAVLPAACPIRVEEGRITAGGKAHEGNGLGCVFVYPRRAEPQALVGVFGHTGPAGARLGYTLLPFVSGVGYPDYALFSPDILSQGADGVLAAGWFDHAWRFVLQR